jgi:hypothetical protein
MERHYDSSDMAFLEKPRWTLLDGMIMFVAFGVVPLMIIHCMSSPEIMKILYCHVKPQTFTMIRNIIETMENLY